MGGPVAQVLFAGSRAPGWRGIIQRFPSLVSRGPGDLDRSDLFHVTSTRAVGGSYVAVSDRDAPPIGFHVDADLPWDYGVLADVGGSSSFYEEPFGLRPDHGVLIDAGCNRPWDHQVLGEIALAIADQLDSVIAMLGLIVPRAIAARRRAGQPLEWPAVRAGVQEFTRSIPGTAVAIPYQVSSDQTWASHTVDAAFLRAWLVHPEFHMIK